MNYKVELSKIYVLFFAIFGSYLSYLNFKFPYFGYVLTLTSLIFYFIFYTKFRPKVNLLILGLLYCLLIILSLLGADEFSLSGLIQQLIYPISFFLTLFLSCNLPKNLDKLADLLLILVLANFFVAIVNSFVGPINLPILGLLRHGRDIFFLGLPSSAGLFWGVNYYAISNLVLSLFISYLYARSGCALGKVKKTMLMMCYLSVVWGSSRSITAILIICLLLILCFGLINHKKVVVYGLLFLILSSFFTASLYSYLSNDSYYNETFRIYKGLNNRDDIWNAGLESIYVSPLLGSGSIASFEEDLISNGSPTTAVQNMYLLSVLKNGLAGLSILLICLMLSFYGFFSSIRPGVDKYLFLIVLSISVDGFFRSYSLGGLGATSFIFSIAISLLINRDKSF